MKIGQTVRARFKTIPALLDGHSHADKFLYPVRTGEVETAEKESEA